jgi:hypothetical protein
MSVKRRNARTVAKICAKERPRMSWNYKTFLSDDDARVQWKSRIIIKFTTQRLAQGYSYMGHSVSQLVEALRCKPEGRGFDPLMVLLDIFIDIIFSAALRPWGPLIF